MAFVGRFAGVPGIWRRDLLTGTVEQVAPGESTMPSISANGRYVSFTTNERLVPEDINEAPDVYRRDMEPGAGEPDYTLVSAVNGSEEGAAYTYTGQGFTQQQRETDFGALAGARSAMSADGNYIAFITTAQSNLLGGSEPTPTGEVFVRDVATRETRLVSAEYEPGVGWAAGRPVQPSLSESGSTIYGAVFPGGVETPTFGTAPSSYPEDHQAKWLGASISANGEVGELDRPAARRAGAAAGAGTGRPSRHRPRNRCGAASAKGPARRSAASREARIRRARRVRPAASREFPKGSPPRSIRARDRSNTSRNRAGKGSGAAGCTPTSCRS